MNKQNAEFEALFQRLERVEKRNRLLIAFVLGAISIFLVFSLLPLTTALAREAVAESTMEAQRFVLKDARGNVRAVLENTNQGPGLTFLSPDGETQGTVRSNSGGLGISWNIGGKTRNLLLLNENFSVGLLDENGKMRMASSLNSADRRFDVGSGVGGGLSLSLLEETSTLSFSDSNSSVKAILRADPFGARLSLLGRDANSQVALGIGPEGGPGLTMHGAQRDPMASMLILPSRGAVILTDAQGKRLDLAP